MDGSQAATHCCCGVRGTVLATSVSVTVFVAVVAVAVVVRATVVVASSCGAARAEARAVRAARQRVVVNFIVELVVDENRSVCCEELKVVCAE